jgi:hypothetical protein
LFCKINIAIPRNRLQQILDKFRSLKNVELIKIS